MKILVCGDRNWGNEIDDQNTLFEELNGWLPFTLRLGPLTIIEGCARGADTLAEEWARAHGHLWHFPADWKLHGKAAGPIRNQQMLDEGEPDIVIAFHHNLAESKGTAHMVKIARKAGVFVKVIG